MLEDKLSESHGKAQQAEAKFKEVPRSLFPPPPPLLCLLTIGVWLECVCSFIVRPPLPHPHHPPTHTYLTLLPLPHSSSSVLTGSAVR